MNRLFNSMYFSARLGSITFGTVGIISAIKQSYKYDEPKCEMVCNAGTNFFYGSITGGILGFFFPILGPIVGIGIIYNKYQNNRKN